VIMISSANSSGVDKVQRYGGPGEGGKKSKTGPSKREIMVEKSGGIFRGENNDRHNVRKGLHSCRVQGGFQKKKR